MIKEWLQEYQPENSDETLSALREIMQEITLAALSRTDFFEKAAFYGGTALRIFYGLERYSEDLDFSLLNSDPDFRLEPYFPSIQTEFESVGITVSLREKKKTADSKVESAFLKTETISNELVLEGIVKQSEIKTNKNIKIKIEIDTRPPLNFDTEEKLMIRPFSFYVKCFSLSSLFAGKLHALLFRKWKNRVKGRDWYDLEWYIRKGVQLDAAHFLERAKDSGDWPDESISNEQILNLLKEKIKSVSFNGIREDVGRFVKDDSRIQLWNAKYFTDLIEKLKFKPK